jgi:quercetin dioxygenase-like cupin family protein
MTMLRVLALLGLALLATSADAQTPGAGGRPVRVVLAGGRLPSVVEAPLHYKVMRVNLAAGARTTYEGPASMVFVLNGAVDVTVEGERVALREGGAGFLPGGPGATTLAAPAASPAVLLQFVVSPAADLDRAAPAPPAAVTELHRTARAIPNLKPGPHEFTMTRVSVEKGSPRPPMHYRSGAAIYYVLSGNWMIHEEGGKVEPRTRGAVQFEPSDFVHSWQNVGEGTALLLQANISAEGSPEIIFLPPR